MKHGRLFIWLGILALLLSPPVSRADAADDWWDDGWPYRIPVTVSGGITHTMDVGIGNVANLLLPSAGKWQVTVAAYDAMGQIGPAGNPVTVTTFADAEQVYLPVLLKE